MKIRRESVRSSRKDVQRSRKASSRRVAKRVLSRAAQVARDNPGKSLVILGMVAIVAIVTVVVLVLPPPSMDVDIGSILGEENIAGEATYASTSSYQIQPSKMYPLSVSKTTGAEDYRSSIS